MEANSEYLYVWLFDIGQHVPPSPSMQKVYVCVWNRVNLLMIDDMINIDSADHHNNIAEIETHRKTLILCDTHIFLLTAESLEEDPKSKFQRQRNHSFLYTCQKQCVHAISFWLVLSHDASAVQWSVSLNRLCQRHRQSRCRVSGISYSILSNQFLLHTITVPGDERRCTHSLLTGIFIYLLHGMLDPR